jgi:hypothetical protein
MQYAWRIKGTVVMPSAMTVKWCIDADDKAAAVIKGPGYAERFEATMGETCTTKQFTYDVNKSTRIFVFKDTLLTLYMIQVRHISSY